MAPQASGKISLWGAVSLAVVCFQPPLFADATIDFAKDIAPLLSARCLSCHSPGNRRGDVSLASSADLKENGYLVPGDPEGSYLLDLVTAAEGRSAEMPKDGEPLSETEIEALRNWILQGADWPDDLVLKERPKADASWWSLQPLATSFPHGVEVAPNSVTRSAAGIDLLIRAKLAENGLQMNPPADRRTLIRRATYDLTGLPPTPEQVAAFVDDPRPDAYEQLIDRLLASPRYGERWGRHWLDVVRFGESIGYERNVIIHDLWPFRDYVIRSLNDDKPFDQFIREHLAGDVMAEDDPQVAIGSAFLVAGPYDDVGNQDPAQAAQIRANTLDEMIRATGQAFLGLTIGCARCHDHKFDPITQQDYYRLYATFSGIRHGSAPWATKAEERERQQKLKPLQDRLAELTAAKSQLQIKILERAHAKLEQYQAEWVRPSVDRTGTEERFSAVPAKFVRLVCEAQDQNPRSNTGFRIDEFEVWSAVNDDTQTAGEASSTQSAAQAIASDAPAADGVPVNVALARHGGKAFGDARRIEDFPGAYGPQLTIDGETGARFISVGNMLTIELERPTRIDRVVFSSARGAEAPDQPKFVFVADYRIEVSLDGEEWTEVAHGRDRQPTGVARRFEAARAATAPNHLEHRLLELEITVQERQQLRKLQHQIAEVTSEIAQIPELPHAWIGRRVAEDAQGPFHVFLGGNPQKKGEPVVPASLSALDPDNRPTANGSGKDNSQFAYCLEESVPEAERRRALADWIVHPDHPLTPRVLANRLWHYHFGTGIVDTPSDFGYMGSRPTHPHLLDFLAQLLLDNGWKIKDLHRAIMLSDTYRQSSVFNAEAAALDSGARLLWRFPPRRLSAEEIRDSILQIAGQLDTRMGGPGFRLYHFMQDNVCTYVPLDEHGPETYRRAVYHQNARASVVDLMTDFDLPDCAFSAPKRAQTVTPLQALTMLNHSFTTDMSRAWAERLHTEAGSDVEAQIRRAYQLCYSRSPTPEEIFACSGHVQEYGLAALCRVLLNTSEMIYVQ